MKLLLAFSCYAFINTFAYGQYIDSPGLLARFQEYRSTVRAYRESNKTTNAYNLTLPVLVSIGELRTGLRFQINSNTTINYSNYKNVCNTYLNPFEKNACNNKLNYLIAAHQQVLLLMQSSTSNEINRGLKELITEKYTHITNTILNELELMKVESDKNWASLLIKN